MYVNISKNVNNKVDSYPPLCHSRGSGNLSSPICRGTMNCAPTGYSLFITGYCILYAITVVNLILYKVPSIAFDLLQMEHRLTDRLLFGSWERQLPL